MDPVLDNHVFGVDNIPCDKSVCEKVHVLEGLLVEEEVEGVLLRRVLGKKCEKKEKEKVSKWRVRKEGEWSCAMANNKKKEKKKSNSDCCHAEIEVGLELRLSRRYLV